MTVVPAMPAVSERVRALHARMTLEEKLAQLVGFWVDQGGEAVSYTHLTLPTNREV